MRPDTPTCVGCSTIGKPDNPLLTTLPQEGTLTFHVCTQCWHTLARNLKEK